MRIAFTIILNGLHHLQHNDYANYILDNFDYWVVVEGASGNKGSTSWCNKMLDKYHNNGNSIDGTIEYLENLSETRKNLIFVKADGCWESKDVQVNRCITEVKKLTNKCMLWEIDIDEQWNNDDMLEAETELLKLGGKCGCFKCHYFLGENIQAIGEWGEGNVIRYNRLWDWEGEYFKCHEPPLLDGRNDSYLLPQRFNHYAFYFEKDVKFKNDWYKGHDGCHEKWLLLQQENIFPQNIRYLFPNFTSLLNTQIIKNNNNKNNMEHFYQNIQGFFTYHNFYKDIVNNSKNNQHFVEIGVWKGCSTDYLAVEIFNSGKNIKLDVVDSFPGTYSDVVTIEDFKNNLKPVIDKITTHKMTSEEASKMYKDDSLDFVFIDTEHDKKNVSNDIKCWYPKVKKGGIIAGHDYHSTHPGVVIAVSEFFKDGKVDLTYIREMVWKHIKI